MNTNRRLTGLLILGIGLASAGCMVDPGPIDPNALNRFQEAMVRRNEARIAREADPLKPTDGLDPSDGGFGGQFDYYIDLATNTTTIKLSLEGAVRRALANNLDIRVVSYDPEISREEMMRAAAVFDAVVFSGLTYGIQDERANTVFDTSSEADSRAFQVGVRRHTTTGADLEARYSLTRLWTSSRFVTRPTTYEPNFTLEATQPLLRGAGQTVNLAALRVARINRRTSQEAFRQRVESVVTDTVSAYWALWLAREDERIQKNLLEKTKAIYRVVKAREIIDATDIDIKQAEASIVRRQALLIRARKNVDDIEDALVQLMLGAQGEFVGKVELEPTTEPDDPVGDDEGQLVVDAEGELIIGDEKQLIIDSQEQLVAALENALERSSQLAQAKLAIQAAGINVRVAENSLLPSLGVNASATWMGLDKSFTASNDQMLNSKYLSYNIGLLFEYPLGNRAAKASLRRAKFERLQAMTNLRNIAVQIARAVKERIRETHRAQSELVAAKAAVKANDTQLRAIVIKREKGRKTPEFLNLELQAIEALGVSKRDVEQAIVDYNTALVQLSQVTGTVLRQYGVSLVSEDPADE